MVDMSEYEIRFFRKVHEMREEKYYLQKSGHPKPIELIEREDHLYGRRLRKDVTYLVHDSIPMDIIRTRVHF